MMNSRVVQDVVYIVGAHFFFFQAEDGIRDKLVTGVQTCALPISVEKQTPQTEPAAGLFFGGDQVAKHPPGGEAYGHLDARDPVTGERKWSINFKYPPIGSVLSTGGGLVIHGDLEGTVHAYDADTGEQLWHFRTGSGHRGGPISY